MTQKAKFKVEKIVNERPLGNLAILGVIAPIAGFGAGLVGASFRIVLELANRFRDALMARLSPWGFGGFVLFIGLISIAAAVAAWLVRRIAPSASGSGIPRVMAVLTDELPPAPPRVIPVKFLGGTLAIGAGLALGCEGPSIQMGASIAHQVGKLFRRNWADCRVLLAAGAGAGFAVAFNAPIAGAVFVFEGLVKRFETRIAMASLAASAVSIWVGRLVCGNVTEYSVGPLAEPSLLATPVFVLLGLGAGFAGMFYSRTLLFTLSAAERFRLLPVELRAAAVAAAVGVIGWFAPSLVGSGDGLAQQALNGVGTLVFLPLLFLLRLGIIAGSVAAGTPGGLLVPFLALGAELGLWFGLLCASAIPGLAIEPRGFAVVGMAAIFTGIIRAPLTSIVLVTEMTANVTMLLPMIVACFTAMLVPTLFGDVSILELLKERLLGKSKSAA